MPTTLTFTLDDTQFTPAEKSLAMDSLGKNAQNIQDALNRFAKAAFLEYANMLTARGVPTRSQDFIRERLMLLLDHYYDELPTENQLSTVFQLTLTQSSTLLKNFNSKYRTRILAKVRAAHSAVIDNAQEAQGRHLFIGTSKVIIDELNDLIRKTHPDILPIIKDTDASGKYSCDDDTFNTLRALFP
jgi:hypothetical protein